MLNIPEVLVKCDIPRIFRNISKYFQIVVKATIKKSLNIHSHSLHIQRIFHIQL